MAVTIGDPFQWPVPDDVHPLVWLLVAYSAGVIVGVLITARAGNYDVKGWVWSIPSRLATAIASVRAVQFIAISSRRPRRASYGEADTDNDAVADCKNAALTETAP